MLLERLSELTGRTVSELKNFSYFASRSYKVYSIPKANGGLRKIEQPSKSVKALQRWICKNLLRGAPVHNSSFAYMKGLNIRAHALRHVRTRFTLRVDFQEFFPSFNIDHVKTYVSKTFPKLSEDDVLFVANIVCRNGALTIGAPSSPMLTNAMMYQFDSACHAYCEERALIYTRYADDIFVSACAPNVLFDAYQLIEREASAYSYAYLKLNTSKTAFLSKKYRRSVTGLVVTPNGSLSIGRDRKQKIKNILYKAQNGRVDDEQVNWLQGCLAFVQDVEPDYIDVLKRKYDSETIQDIMCGRYKSILAIST